MATAAAQPAPRTSQIGDQIASIILKRVDGGNLVLGVFPAVALKCLQLLKNPDVPLRDAAAVIEKDPMLTADLLRHVNSAALIGREGMKSVLQGVTRLGAQKLRNFLMAASIRKVTESRDPRITEASQGLWEHSLAVACLARDVVALCGAGAADPEYAYLGGLLHDIGKPVVASMMLEAEKQVFGTKATAVWLESREWIAVINRVHRRVGVAVATSCGMPDAVCRSIGDCDEYDNDDRLSVANAVRFANALAKLEGIYVGEVAKDDVEALVMIGRSLLNIDEEVVKRLTTNLRATIKSQLQ